MQIGVIYDNSTTDAPARYLKDSINAPKTAFTGVFITLPESAPGAAWLAVKGHLAMDEFIEEIPYSEARAYTKNVLKYLALYRRIYRGSAGRWIDQVIDPNFENNINF